MKGKPGQDFQWHEAQRRCRLSDEALAMARELGLSPRDLIKNIPAKSQPWKAPVEDWVRHLYHQRRATASRARPVPTQTAASDPTSSQPPESAPAPAPGAPAPQSLAESELGPPAAPTELEQAEAQLMARFEAGDLSYEQFDWEMRELHRHAPVTQAEVDKHNRLMLARQQNFRRAAEAVAQALAGQPAVQKVVLFGSVALPLRKEVPRRAPRLRRARIAVWHECNDVDLAVWLSELSGLSALRRLIARTVQTLPVSFGGGVPHHAVDVHILEPGTNRYRGRLCIYSQCPNYKPECYVAGCGAVPFLQQFRDYEFDPRALALDRSVTLFSRGPASANAESLFDNMPF